MYVVRVGGGGVAGWRRRRRSEFRISHRDPRGALLRQGAAARERGPLGARNRQEHVARRALSVSSMILPALFFYLFSGVCIASAFMVIAARNPVHSVLYLILAFVNAAGLVVMLGADFLAMILIVVYVGAVAVLFLVVVIMLC